MSGAMRLTDGDIAEAYEEDVPGIARMAGYLHSKAGSTNTAQRNTFVTAAADRSAKVKREDRTVSKTMSRRVRAPPSSQLYSPRLIGANEPLGAPTNAQKGLFERTSCSVQEETMLKKLNGVPRPGIDVSINVLVELVDLTHRWTAADSSRIDVEARLREKIGSLSDDQQAVLVALTWIGTGRYNSSQFDLALTNAFDRRGASTADFLLAMPDFGSGLASGAAACGAEFHDGSNPKPSPRTRSTFH